MYVHKLTTEWIRNVQEHIQSGEVSSPIPDKKYAGKMFMRTRMQCGHKMFNLLESTTHKISLASHFRLKPSNVNCWEEFPFAKVVNNVKTLKMLLMKSANI